MKWMKFFWGKSADRFGRWADWGESHPAVRSARRGARASISLLLLLLLLLLSWYYWSHWHTDASSVHFCAQVVCWRPRESVWTRWAGHKPSVIFRRFLFCFVVESERGKKMFAFRRLGWRYHRCRSTYRLRINEYPMYLLGRAAGINNKSIDPRQPTIICRDTNRRPPHSLILLFFTFFFTFFLVD